MKVSLGRLLVTVMLSLPLLGGLATGYSVQVAGACGWTTDGYTSQSVGGYNQYARVAGSNQASEYVRSRGR